jgi:dipeptidyl aminopeptidase/acylaminoacyl peptidase
MIQWHFGMSEDAMVVAKSRRRLTCLVFAGFATVALAQPADDPAARFGALEAIESAALSPDGQRIVYTGPATGISTAAVVVDLERSTTTTVTRLDGEPLHFDACGWSAADRLVCKCYGRVKIQKQLVSFSRLFAIDDNGGNVQKLGERQSVNQIYLQQYDGDVIDWLDGTDGTLLITRLYADEASTGTHITHANRAGLGVVRIDSRTLKVRLIEQPDPNAWQYFSDGRGNVRLMTIVRVDAFGRFTERTHRYRQGANREWQDLGTYDAINRTGIEPLAVDPIANSAYVLERLEGRQALYRIALDGSLKTDLVFAHPEVDITGVVTIGRRGRVIGATYLTDREQVEYFDPEFKQLAAALAHALPELPLIRFVSASADEQRILIFASSDLDPGRYFVFDRAAKRLNRAMLARPELEGVTLAPVRPISYSASDGTPIRAYLTLPPGVTSAAGHPAIVMPHGGPEARDVWGFDWLAQYFANRGFVVLQPNFRGSSGYSEQWFVDNGFRSWKIAIGDINDGGRWLVTQGIADPAKLAVVGWSYGGYAALQANVLDPDLFKAAVAIAPATDFTALKQEAQEFRESAAVDEYIGSGAHVDAGSPARHADRFKAPVLMFHGDVDLSISVDESKDMNAALHASGKNSDLIVYPKLGHDLHDGTLRADMLRRADEFLRASLKL